MYSKIKSLLWKRKYIFLFFGLFLIVLTQRFLNERQNGLINSVASDGLGYYCYLPAAVIYQDFHYDFYYKAENKIKPCYRPYLNPYNDRPLNKYYCGTAICFLPFFLTGIVISAIAGTDINGYTDTFLMLISICSILYFLFTTFLFSKIAKHFNIPEKISFITCLIFLFGTNLFHYVIQEPSMSHTYSFFAVTLFFYLYVKVLENTSNKNLFCLGLALGLVALIRPVNVVIILFTPFFSENFKGYFDFVKSLFVKYLTGIVLFVIAMTIAITLQFTFYYLQTGHFYIVSYEGETFNFSKPEFFNMFFSYRKGLFIYTPLVLLSIVFIFLAKKYWYKKIIFFVTFFAFSYITASWWCWWYGGGFSIRPYIDIFPVFIIVIIFLLNKLLILSRRLIFFISIPVVFFNQFMAFQYCNLLIDPDKMNEEMFWDVFLETDLYTINEKKIARIKNSHHVVKMELMNYEDVQGDDRIVNTGYKSHKACVVGKKNTYSRGFGFPIKDLNVHDSFYIIVECMAKTSKEGKDLALAVSIDENATILKWSVVFRNQFKDGEDGWVKMTEIILIDKSLITDRSYMKIFANTEKGENLVDDLKYTIVVK